MKIFDRSGKEIGSIGSTLEEDVGAVFLLVGAAIALLIVVVIVNAISLAVQNFGILGGVYVGLFLALSICGAVFFALFSITILRLPSTIFWRFIHEGDIYTAYSFVVVAILFIVFLLLGGIVPKAQSEVYRILEEAVNNAPWVLSLSYLTLTVGGIVGIIIAILQPLAMLLAKKPPLESIAIWINVGWIVFLWVVLGLARPDIQKESLAVVNLAISGVYTFLSNNLVR